jgi:hypothetical protein
MFEHTREAWAKTLEDFKKLGFSFTVLSNAAYIGYLIYAIATSRGELWVNIPLLVFSVLYLGFFLFATRFGRELDGKKSLKKFAKRLFNIAKRAMKFYTFAVMLYGLSSASKGANAFYVILMALQLMLFLLQIVFDFLRYILEKRFELFLTAIKMDVDTVTKPVKTVSNFFKKLSGEEIEEEPEPTKAQALLSKRVKLAKEEKAKLREERRQEQALARAQKAQESADAREKKRQEQQAAREQKKQKNTPATAVDEVEPDKTIAETAVTDDTQSKPKKKGFFHSRIKPN